MKSAPEGRRQIPRWMEALLSRALPGHVADEVLGDLEEELRSRRPRANFQGPNPNSQARSGPARHLWCGWQCASLLFHFHFRDRRLHSRPRQGVHSLMHGYLQDLRFGLRALTRRPLVSFLALVTLALGIGANSAIFSAVYTVMLKSSPYPNAERTVTIWLRGDRQSVSYRECREVREQSTTLQGAGCTSGWTVTLSGSQDAVLLRAAAVSGDFFQVLGAAPRLGRLPTAADLDDSDQRPLVISSHLWHTRYAGEESVVGREVSLDGRPVTIVGVLPEWFDFPYPGVQAWFPLTPFDEQGDFRRYRYLQALGLRNEGTDLQAVRQEMRSLELGLISQFEESPEEAADFATFITPLAEHQKAQSRPMLTALWAAAGFVLLIACANVANLQLSRSASRGREMALRRALGAGRLRLLRQLLLENLVLALSGGALGLTLSLWAIRALRNALPAKTPRLSEMALDPQVVLFTLAATLGAGFFFGLAPAMRLSRRDGGHRLGGGRIPAPDRPQARLSRLLIVLETALALALVVGAGLMLESFYNLTTVDPGFSPQGVARLELMAPRSRYPDNQSMTRYFQEASEALRALPQVKEAGLIHLTPFTGYNWSSRVDIESRPQEDQQDRPYADWQIADSGYFRAMGIPLLQGRLFEARDDGNAPPVAVVNQTLAERFWPGESALGQRLRSGQDSLSSDDWVTVVGVVGDVRHHGLDEAPQAEMYRPLSQRPIRGMHGVALSNGPLDAAIPAIRRALRELDPQVPISGLAPLGDSIRASIQDRTLLLGLLGGFALLALILGAVGIYGVLSDAVARRSPEMGIRMALGASPVHLKRQVVRQGLTTALAGILLGLAASLALSRLLESHLFQSDPQDPLLLASLSAFLFLVSAAACYLPARRAARTDPLQVLRDS